MTTSRTATQCQQLLDNRAAFDGTNIEFCKEHNISISFYKQQAMVRHQTGANFIQVTTSHEKNQLAHVSSPSLSFNVHSSELVLPSTIPVSQTIALIKGVSS